MDEDTGPLRAAVAYPLRGEASGTRLLFGAGLYFVAGVLAVGGAAAATATFGSPDFTPVWPVVGLAGVLAYVPLVGYTAATVRELLDDEPAPPAFGDWGALLRDGRRFVVVGLLYAVPLVALAGAAAYLAVDAGSVTPVALAVGAAAGLYALAAAYLLPAAAVTVVETGATGAAWNLGTLREAVVDRRYLGRWLLGVAVAAVGGAVGAALAPVVVGFAILFAAHLAAVHVLTHGVVLSLDLTLEGPPPPPASGYIPGWDDGPQRQELSDGRLGGSLLPTTPDGDGGDADVEPGEPPSSPEEAPPTPGSLATTGDGGSSTDLDRPGAGPDVAAGSSSSGTGSSPDETASTGGGDGSTSTGGDDPALTGGDDPGRDIEPFEGEDSDLATDDEKQDS